MQGTNLQLEGQRSTPDALDHTQTHEHPTQPKEASHVKASTDGQQRYMAISGNNFLHARIRKKMEIQITLIRKPKTALAHHHTMQRNEEEADLSSPSPSAPIIAKAGLS